MLKLALLVLTVNGSTGLQATVSEAQDMVDCQEQLETVQNLLDGIDIEIAHISCGQTTSRLTVFQHGDGPEAYRYHYRITVGAEQFALTQYTGNDCTTDIQASPKTYCAISNQRLLGE
ncbi:hypothetical protein [Profundibacter sp.]